MSTIPDRSLTVLGSSSGLPQPDRAHAGYVLRTGEDLALFDCGSGVVRSMLQCGFDPKRLRRVFISHSHADHVTDLPLLIQMLHGLSARTSVTLYLPSEFVVPFEAYLPSLYLIRERLRFGMEIAGYEAGTIHDGAYSVEAIPNSHYEGLRADVERLGLPNRLQSFSFKISWADCSVLYSGDLGHLNDIAAQVRDQSLVVVETTHIDTTELLELASRYRSVRFLLTHLGGSAEEERSSDMAALRNLPNVMVARDGLYIDL